MSRKSRAPTPPGACAKTRQSPASQPPRATQLRADAPAGRGPRPELYSQSGQTARHSAMRRRRAFHPASFVARWPRSGFTRRLSNFNARQKARTSFRVVSPAPRSAQPREESPGGFPARNAESPDWRSRFPTRKWPPRGSVTGPGRKARPEASLAQWLERWSYEP